MYLMDALEEVAVKKRAAGRKHENTELFKAVVSELTEKESKEKVWTRGVCLHPADVTM